VTTIWTDGRRGQARMRPTEAELGAQIRKTLWDFTSRTSTRGAHRDKTAVGVIRGQYPASRELFSDAALVAVLREQQDNCCSWGAYRKEAADRGEDMPSPTPTLEGLLGSPCRSRCKVYFEAREIAERERGLMAAGYRRYQRPAPTGRLWVDQQPRPVTAAAGQESVRAAIQRARRMQQRREATYDGSSRWPTGR